MRAGRPVYVAGDVAPYSRWAAPGLIRPRINATSTALKGGDAAMEPYYEQDGVSLYKGDCRDVLSQLPERSVSTVITSPPFYGLRKYDAPPSVWGGDPNCSHKLEATGEGGETYTTRKRCQHDGVSMQETPDAWVKAVHGRTDDPYAGSTMQGALTSQAAMRGLIETSTCSLCGAWLGVFGNEPEVDCLGWATGKRCGQCYVCHTIEILRALRRVMRKDGVLWWDIDDSRAGGGNNQGNNSPLSAKQASNRGATGQVGLIPDKSIAPKNLLGVPQRVFLAAQADGWIIRSDIKIKSWMPESAKDRPTDSYRTLLMMTPSARYYYDAYAVRVAAAYDQRGEDYKGHTFGTPEESLAQNGSDTKRRVIESMERNGATRNLGNVWDFIPPAAYAEQHFATYSVEEPLTCIKASTPEAICTACGKPRVRIMKQDERGWKERAKKQSGPLKELVEGDKRRNNDGYSGFATASRPEGVTDCGCGAPMEPGIVLDPFCGTGTTMIAARQLGRRGIGIEISDSYLVQAVRRLEIGDGGIRRQVVARRNGYEQRSLFE